MRSTIKKPILFTRMEKDANMTCPGQTSVLHRSKLIARCIRYSYTKYAAKFSQCRSVGLMTGFVILSSEISLPFCNLNYVAVKLNKKSQKSFQGSFTLPTKSIKWRFRRRKSLARESRQPHVTYGSEVLKQNTVLQSTQ